VGFFKQKFPNESPKVVVRCYRKNIFQGENHKFEEWLIKRKYHVKKQTEKEAGIIKAVDEQLNGEFEESIPDGTHINVETELIEKTSKPMNPKTPYKINDAARDLSTKITKYAKKENIGKVMNDDDYEIEIVENLPRTEYILKLEEGYTEKGDHYQKIDNYGLCKPIVHIFQNDLDKLDLILEEVNQNIHILSKRCTSSRDIEVETQSIETQTVIKGSTIELITENSEKLNEKIREMQRNLDDIEDIQNIKKNNE